MRHIVVHIDFCYYNMAQVNLGKGHNLLILPFLACVIPSNAYRIPTVTYWHSELQLPTVFTKWIVLLTLPLVDAAADLLCLIVLMSMDWVRRG